MHFPIRKSFDPFAIYIDHARNKDNIAYSWCIMLKKDVWVSTLKDKADNVDLSFSLPKIDGRDHYNIRAKTTEV